MKLLAMRTLAAPIMWGTTYLTVTELLPDESPLVVAAMRVAPAGLLLLAVARSTGWWVPAGADWLRTSTLSMANFGVFFPLLTVAVERLPGGVAAAFGGLQPLFVAALARALLGTRPTRGVISIALVAALGVALVAIRPGAGLDPVGIAAAIAANASFALGVVLTNRFGAPRHRIAATGWQLVLAAALLVPLALAVDGPPAAPTTANIAGYAHLSLIATAGAFLIWFQGIAALPVAAPPLLGLAAPITGATLGWIVLDQNLTSLQLVGFATTIAAIAYGARISHDPGTPQPVPMRPPLRRNLDHLPHGVPRTKSHVNFRHAGLDRPMPCAVSRPPVTLPTAESPPKSSPVRQPSQSARSESRRVDPGVTAHRW